MLIEDFENLSFQQYRKVGLTRARLLTDQDVTELDGKLQTLEGIVSFQPGDYLAVGVAGEQWVISRVTFERTKRAISEPDATGFSDYETLGTVQAVQIHEPFQVRLARGDILNGKLGDYLVRSASGNTWLVDRAIFTQTYELIRSAGRT